MFSDSILTICIDITSTNFACLFVLYFRFSITKNGPRTFTWAFQKAEISDEYNDEPSSEYRNDV